MEKNNLTVPVAIVVAGVLIAGALFISRGGTKNTAAVVNNGLPNSENIVVDPITASDHTSGSPNAEIFIVEYSDLECPFCKEFQNTMHKIMDAYGKDGKVAWVYRHFPLYKPDSNGQSLHSKSGKESEASECAAELGGNDKFWAFIDKVYSVTPSNNGLDPAELPKIAEQVGLDKSKFETCLSSGKYADKISTAYSAALLAGASGTPYSVIVTKDGVKIPITGAQPYESIKPVLETLLSTKK